MSMLKSVKLSDCQVWSLGRWTTFVFMSMLKSDCLYFIVGENVNFLLAGNQLYDI